jgi:hypothetical protein
MGRIAAAELKRSVRVSVWRTSDFEGRANLPGLPNVAGNRRAAPTLMNEKACAGVSG